MSDIWNDPVWSAVIATVIAAVILSILALLRDQIKKSWQSIFKNKKQEATASRYLEDPLFVDLFIHDNDRATYRKLYGHKREYISLIDDLYKDGFITYDKDGVPNLSPKGKRMIARLQRSS